MNYRTSAVICWIFYNKWCQGTCQLTVYLNSKRGCFKSLQRNNVKPIMSLNLLDRQCHNVAKHRHCSTWLLFLYLVFKKSVIYSCKCGGKKVKFLTWKMFFLLLLRHRHSWSSEFHLISTILFCHHSACCPLLHPLRESSLWSFLLSASIFSMLGPIEDTAQGSKDEDTVEEFGIVEMF